MIFLDASPLISLLLDDDRADESETLLSSIELNRTRAVTTTHVLEEVCYKLVVAKMNRVTGEKNPWKIRNLLRKDKELRRTCAATLAQVIDYSGHLMRGGLTIANTDIADVRALARLTEETGLLTSDCLHLSVMRRLKIPRIATFDKDFKGIKGLTTTP